ncbi:uncharacterized protein F5891DRAFT_967324 [Suillus fuscotomentosus]|uniref:Uncharacterized protein n=1 Tax=Suillus fuscotomentosus TaxID=1912939 RepID=A0AAD4HDA2_9AGAM|nr:uncharacterized protein F5891DRAFT_967324 [Suillus fuscotomentosus]KAG1887411.1 hypothetical protein F5891DRAFT_967324 [Suillus fuscotomentosus]
MHAAEAAIISNFLGRPAPLIRCWSRLRLPHGQIARSAWKENESSAEYIRISRNFKFRRNNVDEFAEVLYFTQLAVQAIPKLTWANVAMVSVYSRPDQQLLDLSHGTVWSCTHDGDKNLQLIDVQTITAVVAMIPHCPTLPSGIMEDRYFMVEKTGLDVTLTGVEVEEDDQEEQDD